MSAGVQLSLRIRGELVSKKFEDFTGEFKKVSVQRFRGRMIAARNRLVRAPSAYKNNPAHHWPEGEKGERARAWWFAALADGRVNEPGEYERSGKYESSWKLEKLEKGDGYRLRSTHAAAKWIAGDAYGEMQYHAHRGRWPELRGTVEEVKKELPRDIQGSVVLAARRKGFRAQ